MTGKLTQEELGWLDGIFSQVKEELNEKVSELGLVPLRYVGTGAYAESSVEGHRERLSRALKREAHAEDFIVLEALGRVRLSAETRKAELKRLKRKYVKRKKYTFRYGRKHNKHKEQTAKGRNERRWKKDPLTRFKYSSRKPVNITQEDWDRCIQPVWDKYDRKYLKVRGGSREEGYTVCNMQIVYHPPKERYSRNTPKPVVVYDGYSQAVYDAMK